MLTWEDPLPPCISHQETFHFRFRSTLCNMLTKSFFFWMLMSFHLLSWVINRSNFPPLYCIVFLFLRGETYMWNLTCGDFHVEKKLNSRNRVNWWFSRAKGWEKWGHVNQSVQISSFKINKFWGSNIGHNDYSKLYCILENC